MTAPTDHLQSLVDLARAGNVDAFVRRAADLEAADLADVLAALDDAERLKVLEALPPELSGDALVEMPEGAHAGETLAALGPERAAEIVEELEDDDAADLLGELPRDTQERILAEVEHRAEVDRLLRYDEETAGGRMTTHVVTVRDVDTATQALDAIRRQAEDVEDFYQVFVVDRGQRLVGAVPLKDLVLSPPNRPVRDFMAPADIYVDPELDQEEVARIMARYNLESVPVVDHLGRLLGRITFDDVIDVVEAESTEDILRFGGVPAHEELEAGWNAAVRSRLPWLYVNLLTAFLAGGVVYVFQDTVRRTVSLAVWMPIIAGMGGNAGTQALAVTVRRLALGLIAPNAFVRVVGKEILVGLINGLANGLVVGVVAVLLHEGAILGVVVFLAMAGNLLVAGFAGAFIPILLERFGVDPAVASSIFVTTFTDVCGFLFLLGLAEWLLL
ncbi:MAG TPA: magnesium transporter [Gemmatimonadales bacterium]|nr:magnesium transporter [Gemmatimonadales bacterium]